MILTESEFFKINNLIESINPNQFKGLSTKIKFLYPNIYIKLYEFKEKLNINTFSEVLYLAINNLDNVPVCIHLSNKCYGKLKFKNIIEGYFPYCKACSSCSDDFKIKRTETNLFRYGYEYPTKNKSILQKIKNTVYSKYGVNNIKQIKR